MSTRAMTSNLDRPSVSVGPPPNKRKATDGFDIRKPSTNKKIDRTDIPRPGLPTPTPISNPSDPGSKNQLLAGYLAHEFLTKGTLFGEPWDPARAEAMPLSAAKAESSSGSKAKAGVSLLKAESKREKYQRYVEVTDLIKKADGAHLPGIVNPTQVARFLQL